MKIQCEYCGSFISDTDEKCPNCGATNEHLTRAASGVPHTIEELKAFCASHNMPLKKMRFFIGEDYKQPRAFGIYKDESDNFVVYKNKADGSRTVRYRGKDEAYAVNELYQKLGVEVRQRKRSETPPRNSGGAERPHITGCGIIMLICAVIFALVVILSIRYIIVTPSEGYYSYNDSEYYYQDEQWYLYNGSQWQITQGVDETLVDDYSDYWQSTAYSEDYSAEDFSQSEYYSVTRESDWSDDDWSDDDWDTDYDSWDSSDTDWESDW